MRGANEIILKILIDLIDAITELIMVLLRASFHVALGMCAVTMILMLVCMIAYILKVTLIEIFGSEPFKKLKEWYERILRL